MSDFAASAPWLRAERISRHFGGVKAVEDVSLTLHPGQLHAVIGTNGAGKSTLVNVLSGEIDVSGGCVELLGQDATRWTQPRRARAGLGRSYQRNNIFGAFSVRENCRLAAQSRLPRVFDWWTPASRCATSMSSAEQAIEKAGLAAVIDRPAGALSHGQKRQLEIAMCLATHPKVLMLDEPLAGMGAEESERMLALLHDLKASHALLLVEHDMDAVFKVADIITVMVDGRVLASGDPASIRANAEVQVAYLGEGI
ncbi:MAG: ABC transporter ATP-binding protein [Rhizobacter sp.]|nr:ABC transporter ATP-binding protein [Rhizobacter sp.]